MRFERGGLQGGGFGFLRELLRRGGQGKQSSTVTASHAFIVYRCKMAAIGRHAAVCVHTASHSQLIRYGRIRVHENKCGRVVVQQRASRFTPILGDNFIII